MDEHKKIEIRFRLRGLGRELPAKLAGVSLPPFTPRVPAPEAGPRISSLHELAELRRETQDDFARARLQLADISERLVSFGPAKARPAAIPQNSGRPAAGYARAASHGAAAAGPAAGPIAAPLPLEPDLETPPVSRGRYLALTALLAVCVTAAFWLADTLSAPQVQVFAMPHQQAAGLSLGRGEALVYADPQKQLLFTVSGRDGRILAAQNFRVPALAGLAADGELIWSSGFNGLARHDLGGDEPEKYFPVAGSAPGPLHWDGKFLWAASPAEATLAKYLPGETLFLSGRYPAPPLLSAGFLVAGPDLYAVSPLPPALCRYKVEGEMALSAKAWLGPFLRPGSKVAGFTMDKTWLWLITENPSELRRLKLSDLAFSASTN